MNRNIFPKMNFPEPMEESSAEICLGTAPQVIGLMKLCRSAYLVCGSVLRGISRDPQATHPLVEHPPPAQPDPQPLDTFRIAFSSATVICLPLHFTRFFSAIMNSSLLCLCLLYLLHLLYRGRFRKMKFFSFPHPRTSDMSRILHSTVR